MIEILPVPYPIEKKDVEYYSKKCQEHLNHRRNSEEVYPLVRFFRIMEFLANSIKRT